MSGKPATGKENKIEVQPDDTWAQLEALLSGGPLVAKDVPAAKMAIEAPAAPGVTEASGTPEPRTEVEMHLERGRELLASVAAFLQTAQAEAATLRLDAARDVRRLIAGRHRAVALSFLFGATNMEAQRAADGGGDARDCTDHAALRALSAHVPEAPRQDGRRRGRGAHYPEFAERGGSRARAAAFGGHWRASRVRMQDVRRATRVHVDGGARLNQVIPSSSAPPAIAFASSIAAATVSATAASASWSTRSSRSSFVRSSCAPSADRRPVRRAWGGRTPRTRRRARRVVGTAYQSPRSPCTSRARIGSPPARA